MARNSKKLTDIEMAIANDIISSARSEWSTELSKQFYTEIEFDGIIVFLEGEVDIEGYVEDDFLMGYMNGTGQTVVTKARVEITEITAYINEGEECEIPDLNYEGIEEYAKEALRS